MNSKFIDVDRETLYFLPPSLQDWLPEKHLARFVVEIVDRLDLRSLKESYVGCGIKPYNPAMMVALLFYGYATGVFSSRQLERSTYDSVAFRFIAANSHPDHDTIANFRRRFLPELGELFTQILLIANQMKVLRIGRVSLDGSKIKANASKHKALSYERACQQEEQIKAEVAALLKKAESADESDLPDDLNIPEELERREKRLAAIAVAKAELEKRAAERHAIEQAAYEKKIAKRAEKEQKTGKKNKGRKPTPPQAGPTGKEQFNLTDRESRIMPVSGGGFQQSFNVQAGVDTASKLIVTAHVSQQPNDKNELKPALQMLSALPQKLGTITELIADSGYFSEKNVKACEEKEITPYIAAEKQRHNQLLKDRFFEPPPLSDDADPISKMKHRLKTAAGKLIYAQRKITSEPVFGIIKSVIGFKEFLLRGHEAAEGEWLLVCTAFNIKRLYALNG